MPTSIRDFPNLLGIEIWNVTLERWGIEAALNADLHPKMAFLIMAHVYMVTLPEGVLSPPFPDLLSDIEIVCTNLTKIPEEVADVWNTLQVIYVETSPLQEFPTALFRLPVSDVSLVNTGLEELPTTSLRRICIRAATSNWHCRTIHSKRSLNLQEMS